MLTVQDTDWKPVAKRLPRLLTPHVLLASVLLLTGCNGARSWLSSEDIDAPWQRPRTPEALSTSSSTLIQPVSMWFCPTCTTNRESAGPASEVKPKPSAPHPRTIFEALHA